MPLDFGLIVRGIVIRGLLRIPWPFHSAYSGHVPLDLGLFVRGIVITWLLDLNPWSDPVPLDLGLRCLIFVITWLLDHAAAADSVALDFGGLVAGWGEGLADRDAWGVRHGELLAGKS